VTAKRSRTFEDAILEAICTNSVRPIPTSFTPALRRLITLAAKMNSDLLAKEKPRKCVSVRDVEVLTAVLLKIHRLMRCYAVSTGKYFTAASLPVDSE
jgi:hypothetical protein